MGNRDLRSSDSQGSFPKTDIQDKETFHLIKCYKLRIQQLEKERKQLFKQLDHYHNYIEHQRQHQHLQQPQKEGQEVEQFPIPPSFAEHTIINPAILIHFTLILLLISYALHLLGMI